ncbi:recombination protein NinB [Pseudoduganella chitinolytica]|uniref:Recombination protein NinB n=1 Tax=Pseudoduganella chitinolytica TaxID=34070 RepID=A0ABY8BG59_9BURK|nr:recombination protein NinB [Pseudoduganella chitinolytica]WEF34905.1 recombination protein NinB [Pseudoduganella chitinolytica]
MTTKRIFFLNHRQARANVAHFAYNGPEGWMVVFSEPKKKRAQEDKYHAMIDDIARQVEFIGRKWHKEDMKRLLIDEFAEEMRTAGTPLHHDGRVVPSFDGRRIVQLGVQSRDFYVKEAAQFIEYLYAFGAARDVQWSEPAYHPGPEHAVIGDAP